MNVFNIFTKKLTIKFVHLAFTVVGFIKMHTIKIKIRDYLRKTVHKYFNFYFTKIKYIQIFKKTIFLLNRNHKVFSFSYFKRLLGLI